MKKSCEECVSELKKRPGEKALCLSELAMLRDVHYVNYKVEKSVLELLIHDLKERFQIRVCERAFLMTTIVPLLQFENTPEVIRGGSFAIACLSENQETHKKIIKSKCLKILSSLIQRQIHHDITKYSLQTMCNIGLYPQNFSIILELNFLDYAVCQILQLLPNSSQLYVLRILWQMTQVEHQHVDRDQICRMVLKKRFIRPILRSMVSSDLDVAHIAIELVNNVVQDSINFHRISRLKLPSKLLLTHQLFSHHENQTKIKKAIMMLLEKLLMIKQFQRELCDNDYQTLALSMFDTSNNELNLLGITCIAYMSEMVDSHDKLVEKKLLDLIYQILKECKDQHIRQQAFKVISCISLNPKYLQNLINIGMIDLLVNSLNSDEKACRVYSILCLSNLSCSQNFHKYISNINIKLLIHILEQADPSNHEVMRAAANTLANISIDHNYQIYFLKDPEKNIVLKLLYSATDIVIVKSIIIIFTNISTNSQLINELAQPDIFECLLLLYQRDYNELRGYMSRCLSALAIIPECRKIIIHKNLMHSMVQSIYKSQKETKGMILLSIMTLLSFSEEFHKQFINEKGTECLLFLMAQNDSFFAYIAVKSLVLISRVESSISKVVSRSVCKTVASYSVNREERILKEGLRFFVNILIHKRPKVSIIDMLCSLAHEVLQSNEEDALQLGLFSLMLVSEQSMYHSTVFQHLSLLKTITSKPIMQLCNQNSIFMSISLMNFSLNADNLHQILQIGLVRIMKELCLHSEPFDSEFDFYTYAFTFIRQMLRLPDLELFMPELFAQGTGIIIQHLLIQDRPYFFRSILESINIMTSINDTYPEELLGVVQYLADPDYQPNDNECTPLRVYILNRMSFHQKSLEYFKHSKVVDFLKHRMVNDTQFINISQYFCSLLANISKENSILNQIFENELLNIIFKMRQFKSSIKLTDIIRLLAHLSSHPLFKPSIFNEEIYSKIFDQLQQLTFQQDIKHSLVIIMFKIHIKSDPAAFYPVLICLLNMTKSDYGLIRAISRSNIFRFIKIYMKEIQFNNKEGRIISFLCFLTISNMLIDPQVMEQRQQEILPLIDQLRVQVIEIMQNSDKLSRKEQNTPNNMVIAFLRVMHNLVLCHYKQVEDNSIVKECIQLILVIFLDNDRYELLGLIISVFCVMVESPKSLSLLKINYPVMIKLFDLLHNSYEKMDQVEQRFRASLLLFIANLTHYEHSFDFFDTFLNLEDFMVKFRVAHTSLPTKTDQELLITIIVNLTYIKEIQLIMPKYIKTLQLLLELFLTDDSEGTTRRILQLIVNLSLNQDLHRWIIVDDILKKLHKMFLDPITDRGMKEQIQILLANSTFSKDLHELLIKNHAINIFEDQLNQPNLNQSQIIALVNISLNVQSYFLIEGQNNMVNSLALVQECDKPLQILILKAALEYVRMKTETTPPQSLQNRYNVLEKIIQNSNSLLETHSKYVVENLDNLWREILQTNLLPKVRIEYDRLMENFVTVINHFDSLDVKGNYYMYLCEIMESLPSLIENSKKIHESLDSLMLYNVTLLQQLKDCYQLKPQQPVDLAIRSRLELLVNLFLRLLSNCALSSLTNQLLLKGFQAHKLEDQLYDILVFSHQQCQGLMIQCLATYANIFQQDHLMTLCCYKKVFTVIHKNYKQNLKVLPQYQHFLNGLIVAIMRNRKFLLGDVELSLVIAFITQVLKSGQQPAQSVYPLTLQCLTNIAYNPDNHEQLFQSKIPEHLFMYIQLEHNMLADGFLYALTSFINLGTSRVFYQRISPEEVFKFIVKLNGVNQQLVVQYSSCIFMQMFEYSDMDEIHNLVEFCLDFMVKEVLGMVSFHSEHMDMFLDFLERLLQIPKLKYKIAKIHSLFARFQRILEVQDISNAATFAKHQRLWNIYHFLISSKECLNQLVKYGYFNLVRVKINYFTSQLFALNTEKPLVFLFRQINLFTLCLQSVERIFEAELNLKLTPPLKDLIFKASNDPLQDDQQFRICFDVPFKVIIAIIQNPLTFQSSENLHILVDLIRQIAALLYRMESNGNTIMKYLIQVLKLSQNELIAQMNIDEKQFLYSNTVNVCMNMFDKFGSEIQYLVEEVLILLISHWSNGDYSFMNIQTFQDFVRICLSLKLKKFQLEKPPVLANSVLQVILANQQVFENPEIQLLFQMFIKKLIGEIDPLENAQLQKNIHLSLDLLHKYLHNYETQFKLQLQQWRCKEVPNKVSEYQRDLAAQNFIITLDILTIIVSFSVFQDRIEKVNLVQDVLKCGEVLQQLMASIEDSDSKEENQVQLANLESFIKHISIFLSYISFLVQFHDVLQQRDCRAFILDALYRRKKQTKIFCFNILVNLMQTNGPSIIFDMLEGVEDLVDYVNTSGKPNRFQLDAIVSLIEEVRSKVISSLTEDDGHSFTSLQTDICLLLTKTLVGKKHYFQLSSALEILLSSHNAEVNLRVLFLIDRKYINYEASEQIRDRVVGYALQMARNVYLELKQENLVACSEENISDPRNSGKLINIQQIWDMLYKPLAALPEDLQDLFFWEEYDIVLILNLTRFELSETQTKLIQLIFALELLSARFKNDSQIQRPIHPTAAMVVHNLLSCDDQALTINITQPEFLMMNYTASILQFALNNHNKKGEFLQLCEASPKFKAQLQDFVCRLEDSKLGLLSDLAELIKIPVMELVPIT